MSNVHIIIFQYIYNRQLKVNTFSKNWDMLTVENS